MKDDNPGRKIYEMLLDDFTARLRELEQLPPRVQTLEVAVSEIRSDFREARAEHQEAHRENHQALNAFRKRMDDDNRETITALNETTKVTTEAMTTLAEKVEKLARKFAFFAGCLYVVLGIGGIILIFRTQVLELVRLSLGAG